MKSTRNIKFCAYLRYKGIHPSRVAIISRGKADYYYDMGETEWQMAKLDFDKSDFIKYADCLDKIKDLAY